MSVPLPPGAADAHVEANAHFWVSDRTTFFRPVTQEQLDLMIARVDREGTGEVSFVDFAALFGVDATPIDYGTADR